MPNEHQGSKHIGSIDINQIGHHPTVSFKNIILGDNGKLSFKTTSNLYLIIFLFIIFVCIIVN